MPQRAHALRVAPIFGPRYVAELARSTTALWEDGGPTPHQVCAWLLAIFRKLTATWHTRGFLQSPRALWAPASMTVKLSPRGWAEREPLPRRECWLKTPGPPECRQMPPGPPECRQMPPGPPDSGVRAAKCDRKKGHPEPNGKFCEHMGRLRAKNVLSHRAPKCSSKAFAAGKLHQNNQHQQQANDDMQGQQNGDYQPHMEKAERCAIGSHL
jgi:hypothetical protein